MNFTREQVLRIVDVCFHMYASDYRADAEDQANEVMDGMQAEKPTSTESVVCSNWMPDKRNINRCGTCGHGRLEHEL